MQFRGGRSVYCLGIKSGSLRAYSAMDGLLTTHRHQTLVRSIGLHFAWFAWTALNFLMCVVASFKSTFHTAFAWQHSS